MLRSKSRSGSVDFGHKNHYSSVFSRTLSSSKLCRGDAVDASAHKLIEKKSNSSENQVDRINSMQQQMRKMEDEIRTTKEKLSASQVEKNRVLDQLNEATQSSRGGELVMEIETLKKTLAYTRDELKTKDKKIGYLEAEIERKKMAESRMADSLAVQHNQLDSAMFDLEEAKIEIASLHEKIDGLEDLCNQISREEEVKGVKSELELTKESLVKSQESEKKACLKAEKLAEEMEKIKKEWKLAVEAEEKSAKAMEGLAMALKEVATDANQAKEKLSVALADIQALKEEGEKMVETMKTNEEKFQNLLKEAKNEAEMHKNTADRLRVEAEESIFAWNGKEMGFVSCIKRAEEERAMSQHENQKLAEHLQTSREETYKLRDVLKQAVNEANAAKSGAAIAREENSALKDCLSEKEEALHLITKENERLRISESAAQENVKQLKRMLTLASSEFKIDDKDQNVILMFQDLMDEGSDTEQNHVTRAFSFNLEDLKFMNEPEDDPLDEDPEKAEALKGSIFDTNAETPKSEVKTPKSAVFRRMMYSTLFSEEEATSNSEEMDQLSTLNEDSETNKHPHRRPSKSMFSRVGGLLTIRKGHRKEPSVDLKTPTGKKEHLLPELKTPTGLKKEVSGDLKTPTTGNKKELIADLKTPPAQL